MVVYSYLMRARSHLAVIGIPEAQPVTPRCKPHCTADALKFSRADRLSVDDLLCSFKYSDGVQVGGELYCIPTEETRVLRISFLGGAYTTEYIGELSQGGYKWTAGCTYNGKVYGYPRSANTLLEIDINGNMAREIGLGIQYGTEHHYGGVLSENGIIYQPPRNRSDLLVIDLKTKKASIAPLPRGIAAFRFSSSVQHSSGMLYFIASRYGKAFMFSPVNKRIYKLKGIVDSSIYDAVEAEDGNIYAFASQQDRGIVMIDTQKQCVKTIHKEVIPGAVGTVVAGNGKLYSVVGSGNSIYQYDVVSDTVACVGCVRESGETKCSGGFLQPNGDIVCIPAKGNYIYIYRFESSTG